MRSKYRRTLAALLGVLALSAVASASASAVEPRFEGTYPLHFTVSLSSPTFERTSGTKVTCSAATGTVEFTTGNTGVANLTFTGCHEGIFLCRTSGLPVEEMKTKANVPVHLVYITKTPTKTVGIVLDPYEPAGFPPPPAPTFLEMICGGGSVEALQKSVLTEAMPQLNGVQYNEFGFNFNYAGGQQSPSEYINASNETFKDGLIVNPTRGTEGAKILFSGSGHLHITPATKLIY
jgi:hypothetical protein